MAELAFPVFLSPPLSALRRLLIYYRRFPGDYLRDTIHLSAAEDGIYGRLLDLAYTTEKPLPLNRKKLYAMARANSKTDRASIERVIIEFFTKTRWGFTHSRVSEEIKRAKIQAKINRANGLKGGRPKTHSVSENKPTRLANQNRKKPIPDSRLQTPNTPSPSALVLENKKGLPLDRSTNGDHAKVAEALPSRRIKKQPPIYSQGQNQETPEEKLDRMEKSGKFSPEEIQTLRNASKRDKQIREGWESKWN
jgi:uncharacterized protein YdaU (DUF1376 family)